jgi:hypothetical protein
VGKKILKGLAISLFIFPLDFLIALLCSTREKIEVKEIFCSFGVRLHNFTKYKKEGFIIKPSIEI